VGEGEKGEGATGSKGKGENDRRSSLFPFSLSPPHMV